MVLNMLRAALVDWPIAVLTLNLLIEKRLPGRVGTAFLSRGLYVLARDIVPEKVRETEVVAKSPEH